MMHDEIIIKTEKICKSFGSTKANIDIDFTLKKGEIHGLVGENGSGKSTLLAQISGVIQSDSGQMFINDELYAPNSPLDAYAHKIGIVVQELGVIAALPVGVNVFLGRQKEFTKGGLINTNKLNSTVRELAKQWDISIGSLNRLAGDLNVESRKQIELLRALALDPEILILDEITQALSYDNRQKLYSIINKYKEMGRSVLVISHDLEEIMEISDSMTILRDGKVVDRVQTSDITMSDLKRLMVGREIAENLYRNDESPTREDKIALSVKNLSVGEDVKDVTFDVYAGEIVGFCGLSDSGIHTIGKAIYGLEHDTSGSVTLGENKVPITSSRKALMENMAYVPKERDGEGLMMQAPIKNNFCLPSLDDMKGGLGLLWPKKLETKSEEAVGEFAVRCRDIFQEISGLSGGNKQKVNLGRWVAKDLSLLILDCPTRGVDVGAKAYIYQLIGELKEKGLGIILISDELLEVIGMADRILVVKNGEVKKELDRGPSFTEEEIIEVML